MTIASFDGRLVELPDGTVIRAQTAVWTAGMQASQEARAKSDLDGRTPQRTSGVQPAEAGADDDHLVHYAASLTSRRSAPSARPVRNP
jgi:hypothetical protein